MKILQKLHLAEEEFLTVKQMKQIRGGSGTGGSGGSGAPKQDACKDKKSGDDCSWEYEGTTYKGTCGYAPFNSTLYCQVKL